MPPAGDGAEPSPGLRDKDRGRDRGRDMGRGRGAVPSPLPAPSPASPRLAVPAALPSPRRNPFRGRDVSFSSPWEAPRASRLLFVAGSPAFEASRGLRKATPSFPFHGRSGTGLPANSSGLGSELYITANYTQNRIREEFSPVPEFSFEPYLNSQTKSTFAVLKDPSQPLAGN